MVVAIATPPGLAAIPASSTRAFAACTNFGSALTCGSPFMVLRNPSIRLSTATAGSHLSFILSAHAVGKCKQPTVRAHLRRVYGNKTIQVSPHYGRGPVPGR